MILEEQTNHEQQRRAAVEWGWHQEWEWKMKFGRLSVQKVVAAVVEVVDWQMDHEIAKEMAVVVAAVEVGVTFEMTRNEG